MTSEIRNEEKAQLAWEEWHNVHTRPCQAMHRDRESMKPHQTRRPQARPLEGRWGRGFCLRYSCMKTDDPNTASDNSSPYLFRGCYGGQYGKLRQQRRIQGENWHADVCKRMPGNGLCRYQSKI